MDTEAPVKYKEETSRRLTSMSTTADCRSLGLTQSDLRSPLLGPMAGVSNNAEKICIDDMLQRHCGEFGYWQLRHFVLTSLVWALEAFHTMAMIFVDREPTWQCSAAGCSSESKSVCSLIPVRGNGLVVQEALRWLNLD
ncbi:organic cation carnitine transporter 4-like [Olea europaea subsp. europaea]|uniref:Organic cation carnitine transporter 4-like n=1 Tax=Olea europaea subsp. europaea TaxID=158383 RepID=A0A8S0SG26_OLEEU|nr:organic cation carnitine transporter 4-like [Olea europaea subsp. europaea]